MGGWTYEANGPVVDVKATGPIGDMRINLDASLSTIQYSGAKGEIPIFGNEIQSFRRTSTKSFLRLGPKGERTVSFISIDYEIDPDQARLHHVDETWRLLIAEMPAGQRRLHEARFQTNSRVLKRVVFEELAGLNTLGNNFEEKSAASDGDAIRALCGLPHDPFRSQPGYSAALPLLNAGHFIGYDDEKRERANRQRRSYFALSCIRESMIEPIRAAVFCDPELRAVYDRTAEGELRVRHGGVGKIELPMEIADKASLHLDLAIRQAMAGGAAKSEQWVGKPVARLARMLFEDHMLEALRRREGDLPPGYVGLPDADVLSRGNGADDVFDGDDDIGFDGYDPE